MYKASAQNCEKGCGKVTKVEPTTIKGVKPNRALLIFKYIGPDGKPVKNRIKLILDKKDTLTPNIDKTGTSKLTVAPGAHKLKFKANYWYGVKMEPVPFKTGFTYHFLIRFEAQEIGATKTIEQD